MPGRQQIPSFKLPSGTTAERDGSYNLTTVGNIFYNTDTSNVEIYHQDPSNNAAWRDLVINNKKQIDISGGLIAHSSHMGDGVHSGGINTNFLSAIHNNMFVQPGTDAPGILNLSWHKVFHKIILKCKDTSSSNDAQLYFIRNNSWKSWDGISSDSRIKENQTDYPIEDSMNIVKTIKVKKYFNTELKKEVKGFIAQEVEAILPEAVATEDLSDHGKQKDFKFLDYRRLLVHSFGAIQLLDQKVEDLAADNKQLAERISALEN